jgi:hypothetical protein
MQPARFATMEEVVDVVVEPEREGSTECRVLVKQ